MAPTPCLADEASRIYGGTISYHTASTFNVGYDTNSFVCSGSYYPVPMAPSHEEVQRRYWAYVASFVLREPGPFRFNNPPRFVAKFHRSAPPGRIARKEPAAGDRKLRREVRRLLKNT